MYYSEDLQSPISALNVRRNYGLNPETEPDRARAIGIYPLEEAPAEYGVSHYVKETTQYRAVPHCVSLVEQKMVRAIRTVQKNLGEIRALLGLPENEPIALGGYFPLYINEADAETASSNGETHTHTVGGVTYYMPDAGVTLYHGNYKGEYHLHEHH